MKFGLWGMTVALIVAIGAQAQEAQALEPPYVPLEGMFEMRPADAEDPAVRPRYGWRLPHNESGVWDSIVVDEDGPVAALGADGAAIDGPRTLALSEMFEHGLPIGPIAATWDLGFGGAGPRLSIYEAGLISLDPRINGIGQFGRFSPTRFDPEVAPGARAPADALPTGIGLFKNFTFAQMVAEDRLSSDVIAAYWSETAKPVEVDGALVAPCAPSVPPKPHAVWFWASAWDPNWRAAHPDHWPMVAITWEGMLPRGGCNYSPNTMQLLLIEDRANSPADGPPSARLQMRYDECGWGAAGDGGDDARGGRAGLAFTNGFSIELLGAEEDTPPEDSVGGASGSSFLNYSYCFEGSLNDVPLLDRNGVPFEDANGEAVLRARFGVFETRFAAGGALVGDQDLDGFADGFDNCEIANPSQADLDRDGTGDVCDDDDDSDRMSDGDDLCPTSCNLPFEDLDHDDRGDACDSDRDGDGIIDTVLLGIGEGRQIWLLSDNCPAIVNPEQADADLDGLGDVCDPNPGIAVIECAGADVDHGLGPALASPHCDAGPCCGLVLRENWLQPVLEEIQVGGELVEGPPILNNCTSGPLRKDGDRVAAADDVCPQKFDPLQRDADGDGRGDLCDADDDNDGHLDPADNCPLHANAALVDTDADGLGDACDPNDDNDSRADLEDNCPLLPNDDDRGDVDGDGLGDPCDDDDDNDGAIEPGDNCIELANPNQGDADDDGDGDACDPDDDNDGLLDADDNCVFTANPDQLDFDADGIGDACALDVDGDGHPNDDDNCPAVPNADQGDVDGDLFGDLCDGDIDGDHTLNAADNCPRVENPDQANFDDDRLGDACDPDLDGDGIDDVDDNCQRLANAAQTNSDDDAFGDACDLDDDNDEHLDLADNCRFDKNPAQTDTDEDGIGDVCDPDDDGDGDLDLEDNCPLKSNADQADNDQDGAGDVCDGDDDDDGISDDDDNCALSANADQADSDNDGSGDVCDTVLDPALLDAGPPPPDMAEVADVGPDDGPLGEPAEEQGETGCRAAPARGVGWAGGWVMMLCFLSMRRRLALCVALVMTCLPSMSAAQDFDFDQIVIGAPLLEFEGGEFSGPLEHRGTGQLFDVTPAFPNGLRFGRVTRDEIAMTFQGTVFLDADDYDPPLLLTDAFGLLTRRNECLFCQAFAFWAVLDNGPIIVPAPETNVSWRVLAPEDGNPGRFVLTWVRIPMLDRFPTPERQNSFQMIWTRAGGTDADVQVRYNRCAVHGSDVPINVRTYVVTAIKNSVRDEDGELVQAQPDWLYRGSYTNEFKKLCLLSNSGERGVWRYQVRNGIVTGCGLGPDWINNAGAMPGDVCHDDNNESGDGCSASCLVEPDLDEDGVYEAPPGGMLGEDGSPYDPLAVYDTCVPNDACGDDDDDGILAAVDNCPVFNPLQFDFDGDGEGDACDDDDDFDLLPDGQDLCPFAFSRRVHPEAPDLLFEWYSQPDFDGDGLGDRCDPDDDGDGVEDCTTERRDGRDRRVCRHFDDGVGNDRRGPIAVDLAREVVAPEHDGSDNDEDGIIDEQRPGSSEANQRAILWDPETGEQDNCRVIPNPDQADFDGDQLGDACDDDADNDGLLNCGSGVCPYTHDLRDNDSDGEVDEATECADGCDALSDYIDNDGDGLIDEHPRAAGDGEMARAHSEIDIDIAPWQNAQLAEDADNCPLAANLDQLDDDADRVGDACDDDDGDGIPVRKSDYRDRRQNLIQNELFDNCRDVHNPDQADLDGVDGGDACDPDDDGDTVDDLDDNCPRLANLLQADLDQDGQGDACDDDWDGDAALNDADNCPLAPNADQLDADDDGLGDACDPNIDDDQRLNAIDNCPRVANDDQRDTDRDLVGDACDDDDDGDGVPDAADNCPLSPAGSADQTDTDNDGAGDVCDGDDDNDDLADQLDNCPLVPALVHGTPDIDTDTDTQGDPCDDDDDNDGVLDTDDNCRLTRNRLQGDIDEDGLGDDCDPDIDGDDLDNTDDNCPRAANADQANADRDQYGDACDFDVDGDGINNVNDNCPDVTNPDQVNLDPDDGVGDACDPDDDHDGVSDLEDNCPRTTDMSQIDTDNDGDGDPCDDDDDGDGVTDGADNCALVASDDRTDLDGDGLGDACDLDDDGDSVIDLEDNCARTVNPAQDDFNTDGAGDACTDSDQDGRTDDTDNCPLEVNANQADADGDGIGDKCDPIDGTLDELTQCRADTPPLLWEKRCNGPKKSIGCAAAPGDAPLANPFWLMALLAGWRRRARRR